MWCSLLNIKHVNKTKMSGGRPKRHLNAVESGSEMALTSTSYHDFLGSIGIQVDQSNQTLKYFIRWKHSLDCKRKLQIASFFTAMNIYTPHYYLYNIYSIYCFWVVLTLGSRGVKFLKISPRKYTRRACYPGYLSHSL